MKKTSGTIPVRRRTSSGNSNRSHITENYLQEFRILSEIALLASFPHDFEYRINSILRKTAVHTGSGRVLIFENNDSGCGTSVTHEWCGDGIPMQTISLQNLRFENIPSLIPLFEREGRIFSKNIMLLPQDLVCFFEPRGVKSVILFQLWVRDEFFGMIGFEECTGNRQWSGREIDLIMTVSGIIANAFECKLNERAIKADRDRAEQSNNAKNEFIAKMSHEIRTPLNAILGMSEALYYKVDSEYHKKIVKSVVSSGKLLLSLLNDVLYLSRIDAGKIEIKPHMVDTIAFLDEAEILYHDMAARKNLTLSVERNINLPNLLLLDEKRVKQILYNLLSNAILFTRWGQIKVLAEYNGSEERKGQFRISVSDTGPGIPKEKLSSVFDEYTQYEDSLFYDEGSTGLGLSISKKLADRMGGDIEVISAQGVGSVFTLLLPTEVANNSLPEDKKTDEDFADLEFIESSILIVDDVLSGIEMIESQLSGTGIKVYSALNGDSAFDILRKNRIDLVIMDLFMPFISGDEMGKIIRTKPELKNIPLVSYTAVSADNEILKNLNYFDEHLFKPVTREELFSVLIRHLKYRIRETPGNNR